MEPKVVLITGASRGELLYIHIARLMVQLLNIS
jgi:hypothetical protein